MKILVVVQRKQTLYGSLYGHEKMRNVLKTHFCSFCKYEDLISFVETDNSSVSEVVDKFTTLLFNNAYQYFGKTSQYESQHQSQNHKPNLWFDNSCKTAKQNFNRAKHEYTRNRSNINRLNLTRCRSKLNKAKRRAKAIFKLEKANGLKI